MNMSGYILTCDAGTTGCKTAVFNEDLYEVCSASRTYDTYYPRPNWAEQDMDVIWRAVASCVRELTDRVGASNIAVVGLTGTMNGVVPVDARGNALRPNIIHSDSRAASQIKEITSVISPNGFYDLTGCRPDHHYMLPKLLWLRENESDIYRGASLFLNTKDYIHGRMTGNFDSTDYSDAGLTVALDINKREWASGLLRDLGLDISRMPRIRPGTDVTDRVSKEAAELTGLIEGTPVAVGGGDGSCTARGAGLKANGNAYCYIGSSAWVSQMTEGPLADDDMRLFHYPDMDGIHCLSCGTVQCGAAAYNWSLENLLGTDSVDEAEKMAMEIAPGSEGVLFLPTLMGERTPYWDANTRGALLGFSLYHDKRHIARAVYEGVAFALATSAGIMKELGYPVNSLMLTGGGANSGLWPQLLSSLIDVEACVHSDPGDATSLGAAIAAGVGAGMFSDIADGAARVRSVKRFTPDREQQKAYAGIFPIYSSIYSRLKPVFDSIAGI